MNSLLDGYIEISSLPMMFTRLNEAINNPKTSVQEISSILSEDPGLTARLLRVVNSAFYNFPGKIDTISRAISIVGTQQLRDLALATSVLRLFTGIPKELVDMDSFWQHSIACGVTARIIATMRREPNVERHFVAGILHDVGRLIMYSKAPEKAKIALKQSIDYGEPLFKSEKDVLGFDHATLGKQLLQLWKIPTSIVEVVAFHHRPISANAFPVETAIVHVADVIVHAMELGTSGERLVPPSFHTAWERAGIRPSMLTSITQQVERQYTDAVNVILSV